ncbi:MAG TPA: hypothetical protein VMF14_20510 [Solirubrobacteraceae bacterium]|nr:hypothetical protein [Solirubrobacteraceae bacterium]
MKKIVLIAAALGALAVAGVAYAASINTYTATLSFSGKKAGTAAKPVPVGYTQNIVAKGTNGNRTAVLTDILTKIYGLKADGKDFPTCTSKQISAAGDDTGCPKGAMVATGAITAAVGAANDFTAPAAACDPLLHVWNSGQGKLTFFFVDQAPNHLCLGGNLKTGQVGPYPATYKTQGKYLAVDVPVPGYVSFPAPGTAGSLETEHLSWLKVTKKVHGKTVAATSSVACLKGKRPYTTTFTANLPDASGNPGPNNVTTVKGSAPCSK